MLCCLGDKTCIPIAFRVYCYLCLSSSSCMLVLRGESAMLISILLFVELCCCAGMIREGCWEASSLSCNFSLDLVWFMKLYAFSIASLLVVFLRRWSFSKRL